MMRLLRLYLELSHLLVYKQWIYTTKWWFFFQKTMKAYSKAVMLSLKIYENILNFNFLMGGIKHIDCWWKCFEAVIYLCKKQWSVLNFIYRLKNRHRAIKWRYMGQFSLQPRLYSDISPFIFMSGIFIVSNHRFMTLYYGLSLITVRYSLRIRYLTYIKISAIEDTSMHYGIR